MVFVLEAFEERRIKFASLRLAIRAPAIVTVRARIPVDSQPFEVRDLRRYKVVASALPVRVLDAQDEAAAAAPRKQEAEKRRPGVARMQGARRAWRESRDDCRFHCNHSLRYRTRRLTREVG